MAESPTRWREVYDDLRAAIVSGKLPPGGRVPAELDLVQQYGYGRNTIRTAITRLEQDGLVTEGARSLGRTVRQRYLVKFNASRFELGAYSDDPVNRVDQWEADAHSEGWSTRQIVADVSELEAPADIAEYLRVRPHSRLVRRRRLRYVSREDVPEMLAMIADTWTPIDIARLTIDGVAPLMKMENVTYPGGIYRALGFRQERFEDEIQARMPTPEEIDVLSLSPGTPVGQHARVGIDAKGRRVRVLISVWAGDRQRITYDMKVPEHGPSEATEVIPDV